MKITKRAKVPKGDKRRVYPFDKMKHGECFEFKAKNTRDPAYNRIYTAARNFAKRRDNKLKFEFAEIDDKTYGCWLWDLSKNPDRKPRVTKQEISKIGRSQINEALKNHSTIKDAAKSLNISSKTFNQIRTKLLSKSSPKV